MFLSNIKQHNTKHSIVSVLLLNKVRRLHSVGPSGAGKSTAGENAGWLISSRKMEMCITIMLDSNDIALEDVEHKLDL
jgi:hypothetical protein